MSKVQGKEADLLSNLTDSGIASELDSRLRDLEKNIAVAREFIKLADESYTELRHKWNLLQEDARNKSTTQADKNSAISSKKKAARSPKTEKPGIGEIESKDEELDLKDFEENAKSERSKSRNKYGNNRKLSEDSQETLSSTSQLENAKRSKGHGSNQRKNKPRSGKN